MIVIFMIISIFQSFAEGIPPPKCYPLAEDFRQMCITQANGTADGPRCFFLGESVFGQSWTSFVDVTCKEYGYGATLANIQSQVEFNEIAAYVQTRMIYYPYGGQDWRAILMALYDNITTVARPQPVVTPTTYWYDDLDSTLVIPALNTWIRTHQFDDPVGPNGPTRYMGWHVGEFAHLVDWPGDKTWFIPLCQITNPAQNFTKTDKCISETPIYSFTGSSAQICAEECARRSWCRSFNFLTNGTCQLFTWSTLDTQCSGIGCATQTEQADCVHYNYI